MLCRRSDHGAFGIAGGAAMRAEFVGEERQAFEVYIVLADTFICLTGATCAKRDFSLNVCEIVEANRQTAFDAGDVNNVHDGVKSRNTFAGDDTPDQSFR